MDRQQRTVATKLQIIHHNKNMIPDLFQNDIPKQLSANDNPSTYNPQSIKIQTFYKFTQPFLNNFDENYKLQQFIQMGNNSVLYPVGSIVAFENQSIQENEKYFQIKMKFIQWIQSGGIRCIPLKVNSNEQQIQKMLNLSHCVIIPDFQENYKNYKINCSEQMKKNIDKIVQMALHANLPLLMFGASGSIGLQKITGSKIQSEIVSQGMNFTQAYLSYETLLLKDLQLSTRLNIENRKKVSIPKFFIKLENLKQYTEIGGVIEDRNKQLVPIYAEIKQKSVFLLFSDPTQFENPDSISLWHKLIVNFVNLCKQKTKSIKEKTVQKNLVGLNKILFSENDQKKGYYKIK